MSTKIEWCDEVWNPVIGCSKVSEGCKNCYAENMAKRLSKIPATREDYSVVEKWDGTVRFRTKELLKNFGRKPKKIFVCSMGDLFHEYTCIEWIDKVIAEIYKWGRAGHVFMILTKRPGRMKEYFRGLKDNPEACKRFNDNTNLMAHGAVMEYRRSGFIKNLWLGVSIESQEAAIRRVPLLMQTPAKVRFVSCEPLLREIDLNKIYVLQQSHGYSFPYLEEEYRSKVIDYIDWVIVGGESGHNARPMHPDWVRLIRDQCKAADVPFFFKQWGEWFHSSAITGIDDDRMFAHSACKRIYKGDLHWARIGKKEAGHLLDGVEHREFPEVK